MKHFTRSFLKIGFAAVLLSIQVPRLAAQTNVSPGASPSKIPPSLSDSLGSPNSVNVNPTAPITLLPVAASGTEGHPSALTLGQATNLQTPAQPMSRREYERAASLLKGKSSSDRYDEQMQRMIFSRSDADFNSDTGEANLVKFMTR